MILLYDKRDRDLNLVEVSCFGHIPQFDFEDECHRQFGERPFRTRQIWQRERDIVVNDDKGKPRRKTIFENCARHNEGAQPLTVGTFRNEE